MVQLRVHRLAQADLKAIFEYIDGKAGSRIASDYVGGIYSLIHDLTTFPKRGTVRAGEIAGLRVIGYRRTASIAFVVQGDEITILGVFRRGKNVTPGTLKGRL